MKRRGSSSLAIGLCVATAYAMLLGGCGHDDGGQPGGSVHTAQWARTYGGASADAANSANATADGGYIIVGYTSSFGAGGKDAWVLKLDASGSVLWQKTYGGPGDEVANSVRRSADGGYVVTGGVWASPGVPGSADAWVMKLDGAGDVIWQKTFEGSGADVANSVKPTADGGFVVAGTRSDHAWVLRLDADGNALWQRTYGGVGYDAALDAQPTSDGGYIVAGYTLSYVALGSTAPWVLKLDADGNVVWQKLYEVSYPANGARSVQQTNDGGYIVAGYTNAYYWFAGESFGDVWVLKLDAAGNVAWQRTYGVNSREEAYSVHLTPDGGYVVAGFTEGHGVPRVSPSPAAEARRCGRRCVEQDVRGRQVARRGSLRAGRCRRRLHPCGLYGILRRRRCGCLGVEARCEWRDPRLLLHGGTECDHRRPRCDHGKQHHHRGGHQRNTGKQRVQFRRLHWSAV